MADWRMLSVRIVTAASERCVTRCSVNDAEGGVVREHLVVVVPGIGGSVLARPGQPDAPLWSVGWTDRRLLRRPELLSLAETPALEPVGLIRSLRPVPFWTAVPGYEGLLKALGHPHPTVLPVPYDFRLGVAPAAERLADRVEERLRELWPGGNHAGRVIVVAHSMGGLVARHWIGLGGGDAYCRALITLGTPHWGAPKALNVLANGILVKGLPAFSGLRDVLRQWPSIAELLPRYQAVVDARPAHVGGTGGLLYPYELPLPWHEWGADPAAAYRLHVDIEQAWAKLPRDGTKVVPRVGYGHGTLRAAAWDGEGVRVTSDPLSFPRLGRWDGELGDGTVPAYAAVPVEMADEPPDDFLMPYRHGRFAAMTAVADLTARYEGRGDLRPFRGVQHPAVLGADLDEVQVAGEPVDVAASIRGDDVDTAGVRVWAVVEDPATGRPAFDDVEFVADAGGYRTVLPPLPPGTYTVRLSAREVPGAGDLETTETVEVFDDADLG
ncbi:esterase/lipase family protein [Polymorphospora lycopeni]|uniref:Lecithin:cholesterol acyltransferase n=1 Tax=Polymorphospora lycopeni TaxID=3140240 RepID=A0ABV5CNL4_9ACTN